MGATHVERGARFACVVFLSAGALVFAPMSERDVERNVSPTEFVQTLRRIAEAIEKGESVRIQVANKRFTLPRTATLSIEHEAGGGDEELELQFRWKTP